MIFEHANYRAFLKTELADRVAANGSYSLRAFSQHLGLSNSFLSEVFQGKKALSTEAALKAALKLGLSEAETHYFCLLVQLECEKDPSFRESIETKLRTMNPKRATTDLSMDAFRVISDWYHFAILELTHVAGFALTPSSAASRLGIAKAEADAAIDRLLRLELLEKDDQGRLRKTQEYVLARSSDTNQALRKFHKQLLDKARDALSEQSPRERVSSSDIVPIDSKYVEDVRKLSDRFTAELLEISNRSKHKDRVYCLSVHFFDLTQKGSKPHA